MTRSLADFRIRRAPHLKRYRSMGGGVQGLRGREGASVVQSKATTVEEYVKSLSADRRKAIEAVRKVILDNLPEGFVEMMDFGMISYAIPLARFPNTYNGHPLWVAGLASQKNYMSVYLMSVYGDSKTRDWFLKAYKASGKRLDMGKSCVRFRKLEDLSLDVVGKAVAKYSVEDVIAATRRYHGERRN